LYYFRYAESYSILEEENKSLRNEIRDLRSNLKINKEIIEGFFNKSSKGDKNAMCIAKLKEENEKLYAQTEKLAKEKDDLRSKVFIYIN
jgi:hypothetical protein